MKYVDKYELFEMAIPRDEWYKRIKDFMTKYYKIFKKNSNNLVSREKLQFAKTGASLKISLTLVGIITKAEFIKEGGFFKLKNPSLSISKKTALSYYDQYVERITDMRTNRDSRLTDAEKRTKQDERNDRYNERIKNDPKFAEKERKRVLKYIKDRKKNEPEYKDKLNKYGKEYYHKKK